MAFRRRAVAQVVLTLLLAAPASAYRREYLVTLDGVRKPGSEVCFYRGATGSALSLFFTPGKVACLPADSVLDLPPGTFNFFARHKAGFASVLRDYTIYNGPPIPERGYQQLEIPLVPAGTVDVAVPARALTSDESLGVWVAPTPTSLGSFIPLVTGETAILAPADTPLLPLLIRDGVPVAVGKTISVDEGGRVALPAFERQGNSTAVVVWVRLDKDSWHAARSVLQAPDVVIASKGKVFKPEFTFFEPTSYTILVFRDVPLGPADLTLTGTMWKSVKRQIEVWGPVTVEREGLPMVAGGSVRVRWSAERDVGTPVEGCTDGSPDSNDLPRVTVRVLKCDAAVESNQRCSTVAAAAGPFQGNSSVSVDGIPAGSYVVAVRSPSAKEQRFPVEVVVGQQETIPITITPFGFFGTVKLNSEPVHARLIFATGEAITDDTGRYSASLAAAPLNNNVRVELCGSSRWFDHFPAEPIKPNSSYDIDLSTTPLRVRVTDPENRPVKDAAVSLCIVKQTAPDGKPLSCRHAYPAGTTDDSGMLTTEVGADFSVQACASHKSFVQKCGTVLQPNKLPDRQTVVQFEPVGLRGRVEGHSGPGMLTFVSPTGQTTEDVQLSEDGAFVAHMRHAPPEHFVYASAARPLTVLPMPLMPSDELIITVPPSPIRSFTVTVPNMTAKSGFVGVWVGGNYVPLLTMDFHQTSRGVDSILYRGKSVQFRDISETGPIAVAFGVPPDPTATQFVDIFTLPQFLGIERHVVKSPSVELSQ